LVDDDAITFPDAPRAELDRALAELVDRAHEVMQTQGRLRALVKANRSVVSHLELPVVLRSIVEAAVDLVGAEYGALGVLSPSGGLEQFIHVGMTPEQVERIGHLPEGHGLLGALIDDPRPIRLERIADDPRSAGFPAEHPAMESFLGVPIRVRDSVFGNLYLTNHAGTGFSKDDEQLVGALAATAGFAIDNARLYAETESRRAWSAAASEISATLLAGEPDDALSELVAGVTRLTRATLTCVLMSQGFASAEILSRWADIVGPEVAASSEPMKINWPRVRDEETPEPATLVLRVEGPAALEIQHLSAVILERVNRFFGWQAIGRIALRQAPLRRRVPKKAPAPPDPAVAARIAESLPGIEDEARRQAIGRLGAAIKRK